MLEEKKIEFCGGYDLKTEIKNDRLFVLCMVPPYYILEGEEEDITDMNWEEFIDWFGL